MLNQGAWLDLLICFELFAHKPYENNLGQFQKKKLPIGFSNSFFSSKQLKRKFPVQAALHTILDGALIGVLLTVAVMSSVALHTQYLWTEAFTKLEKTRDLSENITVCTTNPRKLWAKQYT